MVPKMFLKSYPTVVVLEAAYKLVIKEQLAKTF